MCAFLIKSLSCSLELAGALALGFRVRLRHGLNTISFPLYVCVESEKELGFVFFNLILQVGTCWGLGLIIGPAMGGYLSQVCIWKHVGI